MIAEWRPAQLVVGLPEGEGAASIARAVRAFVVQLGERYPLPVATVDETLTSVEAQSELTNARRSGFLRRRVQPREHYDPRRRVLDRGAVAERESMSDEVEQLNSRGELRHLINLGSLDRAHLEEIIDLATRYLTPVGAPAPRDDILHGRTVANLFFEPSTRTRASFELAAKRLRADVLNLDVNMSSRAKGESILDTIYTLQAMQVDIFVVRDASTGVPARIAQHVTPRLRAERRRIGRLASDAGLARSLTLQRHKGDVASLRRDRRRHQAFARRALGPSGALQVRRRRAAPRRPAGAVTRDDVFPGSKRVTEIESGIRGADVVMALRVQRERFAALSDIPDPAGVLPPLRAYRGALEVGSSRRDRDASRTDEPRRRDRQRSRADGPRP